MKYLQLTILMALILCPALWSQGAVHLDLSGLSVGDEFGSHVAGAGDVNGDGVPDLLVAAPFDDTLAIDGGRAVLVSGADGLAIQNLLGSLPGQLFGSAVSGMPDMDGDGSRDFAVATVDDSSNGTGAGLVEVYSSATGLLLLSLPGLVPQGNFGRDLSAIGDLDGDGEDDLLIGADGGLGMVVVHSSSGGGVLLQWAGVSMGSRFGSVVADAGDTDLDGIPDILVGALLDDHSALNSGSAYIFSGATGAQLHRFDGLNQEDRFGRAVASMGDVDGDGASDVVITSIDFDGVAYARGFSGLTGALLFSINGNLGDDFGHAVAGVGDANGDGVLDFCVGAPDAPAGSLSGAGAVRFFSGADGSFIGEIYGQQENEKFGYALGSVGDMNGDGLSDVLSGSLPTLLSAGIVRSVCTSGTISYGVATPPASSLGLSWLPGVAPNTAQGVVACDGAGFGSGGIGIFGVAAGDSWMSGVNVRVLTFPGTYGLFSFAFDVGGSVWFPVDLRQPALAGLSLYMQCFEFSATTPQGVLASPGIELVFSN